VAQKPYRPEDFDPSAFSVLGVEDSADQKTCKKAYRKLARGCHPDRHPGDTEADARFKTLNAAYELIKDERELTRYVEALAQHRKPGFSGLFDMFSSQEGSPEALAKRADAEAKRLLKAQEVERIRHLAEQECHRLNAIAKAKYAREMSEHKAKLGAWEKRRAGREQGIDAAVKGAVKSASRGVASDQVSEMLSRPVSAISRMFARPRLRVGARIIELDSSHPAPMPSAVMDQIQVPQGLTKSQAIAWRTELMRLLEAENKKS